jgi:hypothetical protein
MGLSDRDWQFVNFMVRLGVYTTIVSIPIGVLAMRKWSDIPLVPVFLISTTALIIRSLMNGRYLQNNPTTV